MGRRFIEGLLQAKADEEPLWCGDWCEKRCGENITVILQGFMGSKIQVLFRYEDPKKIIGRAWIGLACIPVWVSIIIVAITNATFPVWPLHEPDLSYADPNYGKLARPGVWCQNQLPDGQCKIHQQRYCLSLWLISTLASFLSQVLGSFGLFSCQLWASTTL